MLVSSSFFIIIIWNSYLSQVTLRGLGGERNEPESLTSAIADKGQLFSCIYFFAICMLVSWILSLYGLPAFELSPALLVFVKQIFHWTHHELPAGPIPFSLSVRHKYILWSHLITWNEGYFKTDHRSVVVIHDVQQGSTFIKASRQHRKAFNTVIWSSFNEEMSSRHDKTARAAASTLRLPAFIRRQ